MELVCLSGSYGVLLAIRYDITTVICDQVLSLYAVEYEIINTWYYQSHMIIETLLSLCISIKNYGIITVLDSYGVFEWNSLCNANTMIGIQKQARNDSIYSFERTSNESDTFCVFLFLIGSLPDYNHENNSYVSAHN